MAIGRTKNNKLCQPEHSVLRIAHAKAGRTVKNRKITKPKAAVPRVSKGVAKPVKKCSSRKLQRVVVPTARGEYLPGLPLGDFKVAIDPGHGGEDVGAEGARSIQEKSLVLDLARQVKDSLQEAGVEVLLTREEDIFVPLYERTQMANQAGADLFVSLHMNAARARTARGSEVYFLTLGQGDVDAQKVAALENCECEGAGNISGNPLLDSVLQDLSQKAYLQESERLAVAVQNQLNRLGGIRERGVKQAPFAVLRGAAMPAVLVEVGFISNPKEAGKLQDPAFLKKAADSIAMGVRRYLAAGTSTPRRQAKK